MLLIVLLYNLMMAKKELGKVKSKFQTLDKAFIIRHQQTCQLSRISCESHSFPQNLMLSRLSSKSHAFSTIYSLKLTHLLILYNYV